VRVLELLVHPALGLGLELVRVQLARADLQLQGLAIHLVAVEVAFVERVVVADRLTLRVRLLQLTPGVTGQHFLLSIRATDPGDGYAVRSGRRFPVSNFSCACVKRNIFGHFDVTFGRPGQKTAHWRQGAVAIHASSGDLTAIISSETPSKISGLTIVGAPFSIARRDVRSVAPAPDFAVIDTHIHTAAAGVLVVRGIASSGEGARIVLQVVTGRSPGWIMPPVSTSAQRSSFTQRVDLFAAVQRAGYDKISDVLIFINHLNPRDRFPLQFTVSDVAVVSNATGPSISSPLEFHNRVVATRLGTGIVPLALRFSHGQGIRNSVHRDTIGLSVNTGFSDHSGNRWLVFSQRFDTGWNLLAENGEGIPAVHIPAFGMLNAWYIPGGLHGTYKLSYLPDRAARFGAFLALAGALLCGVLVLSLFRRPHSIIAANRRDDSSPPSG